MTISIRLAVPADVPALAALGRAAFVAAFGHLYTAENLARFLDEAHGENHVARQVADPAMACLVAEADGGLAGFCKVGFRSSFAEHARGRQPMELKQLYTDPARIGQGIGAALMGRALDMLTDAGADEIQLSVWSENHGAQRFYARYGFEKVAEIDFWVGDHRDDEFLYARLI